MTPRIPFQDARRGSRSYTQQLPMNVLLATPEFHTVHDQEDTPLQQVMATPTEPLLGKPPPATFSSQMGPLIRLTRPSNYPGILLFHLVGVYLAVRSYVSSIWHLEVSSATVVRTLYRQTLQRQWSLWIVLCAILLTSSTSMVVNDYYDAKLGRDDVHDQSHALAVGLVSYQLVKAFLMYQYATALLLVPFLPGVLTRFSVVLGLILTYLYTSYLKPITWIKNIVCALLIALSPLTSGAATLHLLQEPSWMLHTWSGWVREVQLLAPSLRLTAVLFTGVLGREILMDCNDVDRDRHADIRTVPVVFGRRFAAKVALACSMVMTALAVSGPVRQVLSLLAKAAPASPFDAIRTLWSSRPGGLAVVRRLSLAVAGSLLVLFRYLQVLRTEAADKATVDRAVEESLTTVLFLLLSFI
jgi:4-hydroxybenzoate polyprenyltransferase